MSAPIVPTDPGHERPGHARPGRRDCLAALLLATLCALAFLRTGVRPDRAVLPFAPERFAALEPAAGAPVPDDLRHGNVTMGDKFNQSLAWDRITQDGLREGRLPLWSEHIGGGAPFVPQMAQVYQPWNLFTLLPLPSAGLYGIWYLLHLVVFGVGAWWFLRRLGMQQPAALFGLVLATLGLWTQARVHHNVILSAALPLWPLLSLVLAAFRGRGLGAGGVAGVAVCLGISWSGGFAPVSLQASGLAAGLALLLAARERRAGPLLPLAAGALLGGMLALAQMVPTLAAAAVSSRVAATPESLASSALSAPHLLSALWPDLLNWPVRPYHAPSFAQLHLLPFMPPARAAQFNWPETSYAVGLPAVALLPALLLRPRLVPVAFVLVGAVAFGIATAASPFLELTAVLPGARAGDLRRFLFLTHVGLVVGGAAGADILLRDPKAALRTAVPVSVAALFASVILLGAWAKPLAADADFAAAWAARIVAGSDHLQSLGVDAAAVLQAMGQRATEIADNHSRQLATFSLTAAAALLTLAGLGLLRGRRRIHALATVTAVQLLVVGAGTIVPVGLSRITPRPTVLEPVQAARSADRPARLFRLYGRAAAEDWYWLLPPNLGAYYAVEDLAAYNPLPPARLEELVLAIEPDRPGKPSAVLGGSGVRGCFDPGSLDHPLLDLLGVRFVLTRPAVPLPDDTDLSDRTPPGTGPRVKLLERNTTWPRATFVDTLEIVPDRAERLARLADRSHPLRSTVLLEVGEPLRGDGVVEADVEVVEHEAERVVVAVDTPEPGALRLADPWDPGWTATVDGVATPCLVADHYLRAVRLPAGRSTVEFRYDGPLALWPRRASLAGLGIVLLLLLRLALRRRRAPAQSGT